MNSRSNDSPQPSWREYVEARRDYVDARLTAIGHELHALERSVDSRFRDGELVRNEGLNRALILLREGMDRVEARAIEKFQERDRAREKAEVVMEERLHSMNAFRDQINSERLSYVTRDQLEDNQKGIISELDILKRAITLSAGKESGMSKTWAGIVIAFSILSALSAAIVAIGAIVRFSH